jgi:hypothetical protein
MEINKILHMVNEIRDKSHQRLDMTIKVRA